MLRACADRNGGRPNRAHRAGDVIAAGRVRDAGADADPQADFVARRQRGEEFCACGRLRLGDRKSGGQGDGPRMVRRRHMGIIDLEAVDCSAVGERGIGRADFFGPPEQRGHATAAEANHHVARDLAPALRRAVEPAADRIEQAQLEMRDDIGRHRL